MLIITIDKINAVDGKQSTLHKIIITNDGTGDSRIGNYHVRLQSDAKEDRVAYVRGHKRREGALKLLHMALEADVQQGMVAMPTDALRSDKGGGDK